MFKHKKTAKLLDVLDYYIPDLNTRIASIECNLRKIESTTKYSQNGIKEIENHLFQKDTEMIIHNGKRYRIAESQLTAEAGERTILDLHCVECDDE